MTEINIIHSDAVKWAKRYKGPLFHALLCDPPYHLTSITKRFGKGDSAPAQFGKDGAFARASSGFMGQKWDGGDVAFNPKTWKAFSKVMHPGAFGMAFASSRGWHRLAVAIEDAGFIIHPTMFGWVYASGFPKATNPSEAIKVDRGIIKGQFGKCISDDAMLNIPYADRLEAYRHEKALEGHRYGLQALKPALEPIIIFQKPYDGRPLDNIKQTGAGTLNIDAGRIGTDEIPSNRWTDAAHPFGNGAGNEYETVINSGRWPANFLLMDQESAAALDRQSGQSVSRATEYDWRESNNDNVTHVANNIKSGVHFEDAGGASRFFYQVADQLDDSDPVFYCTKPGKDEKDAGLRNFDALSIGDGLPSPIDNAYQRGKTERHNPHPTVKPIDLSRYLAKLLLPPAHYGPRRVFIPFSGVASEVIGAMQAGWDEITGVEMTETYIPIANARIEYWRKKGIQIEMF